MDSLFWLKLPSSWEGLLTLPDIKGSMSSHVSAMVPEDFMTLEHIGSTLELVGTADNADRWIHKSEVEQGHIHGGGTPAGGENQWIHSGSSERKSRSVSVVPRCIKWYIHGVQTASVFRGSKRDS